MSDPDSIVLLGGGRMGSALLRGWIEAGVAPERVTVIDPAPSPELLDFAAVRGIAINGALRSRPRQTVVLAVKPQKVAEVTAIVQSIAADDTLIVSIMAGKTVANLRALFPVVRTFVRAMPNLPASVGRGVTVAFADPGCAPEHLHIARRLLGSTGELEWLNDETLIDAATGLSGSGPAYVFYLADCLVRAGVAAGLPEDIAVRLARATISGAGELLRLSTKSATELRQDVTSPAGTTAAGLQVLMRDDLLQTLLTDTVAAAARRARELAG
jgi:pyrroline-5-carboxylate reductase